MFVWSFNFNKSISFGGIGAGWGRYPCAPRNTCYCYGAFFENMTKLYLCFRKSLAILVLLKLKFVFHRFVGGELRFEILSKNSASLVVGRTERNIGATHGFYFCFGILRVWSVLCNVAKKTLPKLQQLTKLSDNKKYYEIRHAHFSFNVHDTFSVN